MRIPPGARRRQAEKQEELHTSEEEADAIAEAAAKAHAVAVDAVDAGVDAATGSTREEAVAKRERGAPTATARCRFESAANALRAVEGLKEVSGSKVEAFLVETSSIFLVGAL